MHDTYARRFGRPQVYAVLLLLAFLAQCVWVMQRTPAGDLERMYVREGRLQWEGVRFAGDGAHSPFVYLLAGAAPAAVHHSPEGPLRGWLLWVIRLPFLISGLLLGASVWYVARRLYANAGGYIALALYCFCPLLIIESSHAGAGLLAAWGFFGTVFTGIATAHTLYAPPSEIWREARPRLMLLALSIGVAVGADFLAIIGVALAFAFILYLVPGRRLAGIAMLAISTVAGLAAIAWVSYFFSPHALADGLSQARLLGFAPGLYTTYTLAEMFNLFGAALFQSLNFANLVLFSISLVAYIVSRRSRYFGNTAPLIVVGVVVALIFARPVVLVAEFLVWLLPFVFVFIGGLFADLLESRERRAARWVLLGLVSANVILALYALHHYRPPVPPGIAL